MNKTLGERLFDLEARIEGIFPLTIGDPEGYPEWFEGFCEDADSGSRSVFELFEPLRRYISAAEYPEPSDVADTICMHRSITGWVCRVAWCPRRYLDRSVFTSGWGVTRWSWVYGETADQSLENALAMVRQRHADTASQAAA